MSVGAEAPSGIDTMTLFYRIDTEDWVTQQWLRFLSGMKAPSLEQLEALDKQFQFTQYKEGSAPRMHFEEQFVRRHAVPLECFEKIPQAATSPPRLFHL